MEKTRASKLRRLAEQRLAEESSRSPQPQDQDLRRLVAELQIHQYELEIQNEELIRARAETENWLDQYTDLYDSAPVSYLTLTPDGTILHVNLAGAVLLGVERSRLINKRFPLFLSEQYRRPFMDSLDRVLASDTRVVWEAVLIGPGDQPRDIQVQAVASRDGRSCRAVVLDITDRKRAEAMEEARRKEEQARLVAEQANAAKDRFLAVLSHELRTPLTPVLAAVSILQRKVDLDPGIRETLHMARRNLELEARLIDDLLDFTRIANDKLVIKKSLIDICSLVGMAVDICCPDLQNRGLNLTIDLGDEPCTIEADPARIEQVIWNLLKNAIKFTPRGGSITVRCRPERGQAVLSVIDTGVGFELEAMDRIFSAFEQGERSTTRRFGGLGLGLSISKAIVETHGGKIEAYSPGKDKGAQFTVTLPLAKIAPAPLRGEAPGPATPEEDGTPALHILLVEDHGDTAELLEFFLASEGHQVTRAADVATALEAAGRDHFDFLISDLGLPDGSGIDLMNELRARGHRVLGIALSGYGLEKDVQQTTKAGFAAHLVKPVDVDRLAAVIRQITSKHKAKPAR